MRERRERPRPTLNPIFGLVIVGCFFAGLMTLALHLLHRDQLLGQSTHRAQATVEHVWSSSGKGAHYHVRLHFTDDQNVLWTVTEDDVSRGTYMSVKTGVIVPVKYLPEDPTQSRIDWPNEIQYHWHTDRILFYIALGVGVIWVLVFWSAIRRR
jgi:hypothetical protein